LGVDATDAARGGAELLHQLQKAKWNILDLTDFIERVNEFSQETIEL
jgi:hypothetical protein